MVLALGFLSCTECEEERVENSEAPTVEQNVEPSQPRQGGSIEGYSIEVKLLPDGDRLTPVPIRTYYNEKAPPDDEKKQALPPDAQVYTLALETDRIVVYRFPEYQQWSRLTANGYVIVEKGGREALVIDPGVGSVRMLRSFFEREKAKLRFIAVTHGHLDHTGGVAGLKETFPKAVFIAPAKDAAWMGEADPKNFAGIQAPLPPKADKTVSHGDVIELGKVAIDVLEVPGHTIGSVVYAIPEQKVVFTGDTLMKSSIGRTDLPHAERNTTEIESIFGALMPMPDDTIIYSGHGMTTMIGEERKNNPYLKHKPDLLKTIKKSKDKRQGKVPSSRKTVDNANTER